MTAVLLKFAHVLGIALWSAGLVCLPFLYLQRRRLVGDALHRLHNFTRFFYVALVSPAAFVAVASGTALVFVQETYAPWFSLKLALVAAMVAIHATSGLVILSLFEPGKSYPFWRFAGVTTLTVAVVGAILLTVLAKPEIGRIAALDPVFTPGALGEMLGGLIAWSR